MAQEQVDIFETIAKGTVTLKELKEALSQAKKDLDQLNVGEKEYQDKLKDVITLQNLMKGAVNGTTASLEDMAKAANGDVKSYNALVNQMANMKRELRNVDVSTEEGAKRFEELAKEINKVNGELKKMDEKQGSFVRNVGNYKSALEGAIPGLKGVNDGLALMGKQPILGIITLLAPLISDITAEVKGNKKMLDALKPVMDFLSGLMESIVSIVTDLINKAAEFVSGNGLFKKIIEGVMGVGNAILQFIITPFKAVAAAIKVFQDEGVKGIGNAAKAMWNEVKSGVSFKTNFETGAKFADTIIEGAKSRKKAAHQAGREIGKSLGEGLLKELDSILDKVNAAYDKKLEDRKKLHEQRQKEIADYNKQAAAEFLAEQEEEADEAAELWLESYHKQQEEAEETAKKKIAAVQAVASATSSILTTIADAYENNTELTEREAKRVKNLRVIAATIDMIQGAVTAFSTAMELGPIAGPIVGAINAAAVIASGLANIAKIKSTNVSKDGGATTVTPTAPAAESAPILQTAAPTTAMVTGASTESALNRAGQPQKVYILQSDIEAAGDASKVQVAESSF